MKKKERSLFYDQMDDIIPILSDVDQMKIEFVKTFLEKRFQVDDLENSFVIFDGKMGTKSLVYLLFAMILEYDSMKHNVYSGHNENK